ncbi:pancreatic triacylglycerol lipase-like [Pseudomyrmex gracilis]|uniref:pancreatic triacylglycerol lipase-like n=1 Tax=Pseudomyrmex gracilis TaxID=219809 RepID=UPI0009956AB5|nr:pancreatic triacylglycerol lipase-like [Pseudomyrmex gracilis]
MILVSLLFAIAVVMHAETIDGAPLWDDLNTIFLRLYTGTTMDEYIDYWLNKTSEIPSKLFVDKPTVLYFHGFTENVQKTSVRTIVKAYLKRNDHNVLAVDFGKLVNDTYPEALINAPRVAAAVVTALDDMVKSGFDPKKLHVVAHSLGAQISSYVGRKVSFKIPRITGLDPAGPGYNILQNRLSDSDADFVDIIHTDFAFYGIGRSTGSVDFFPNGGERIQPGCPMNFTIFSDKEFCSHHRSWRFYAESLLNESSFVGVECSDLDHFVSGKCKDKAQIIMGYGTPSNARGKVYLTTATQSPFGLKLRGIEPDPIL